MAVRDYPRFLFSNPQNVKPFGPYIVHTIYPRFIAMVKSIAGVEGEEWRYVVTSWDEAPHGDIAEAMEAMREWFDLQLSSGEISFTYVVKNRTYNSCINEIVNKLLNTGLFKKVSTSTSNLKQSHFTLEVEAINGQNVSVPINTVDMYEQVLQRLKDKSIENIPRRDCNYLG